MNMLQNFIDEQLGEVRVLLQNNEAWFAAKDICDILCIANSRKATTRLVSFKKLTLLETKKNYITERRAALPPHG